MLDKLIKSRRSIKKYKSKTPDWRVIIECIDSMRHAPMAGGNYSIKTILIDDPEIIEEIAKHSEQQFIKNAQYVVAVCSKEGRTKISFGDRAEKYLRQQAGAAIQNFLLSLENSKLSTCWVGHFYDDKIKRLLKIPEDTELEAIFPIGYANEKPKKKSIPDLDSNIFFNKYGNTKMQSPDKLSA